MEKAFVAQRVTAKLHSTEKTIDTAMMEAAELLTTVIEARRELNLSTVVADKELAAINQAIAALDSARRATVEAHNGLNKIAKALHLPVKAGLVKGVQQEEDRTELRVAS